MCIAYNRTVNPHTVPNRYPVPRIDYIFDKVTGCLFFSVLDLKSAYH